MDTSTERYDHAGLRVIAALAWDNILTMLKSELRVSSLVRRLSICDTNEEVVRTLGSFDLDPEDFGFEKGGLS